MPAGQTTCRLQLLALSRVTSLRMTAKPSVALGQAAVPSKGVSFEDSTAQES